jgi:amino acid adenylation domain-containing protein
MIQSLPPIDSESNQQPPVADDEVYVFPVSFAQQRMWFFDQFEPGSPGYNIPSAVRLTGQLDVAALEEALNEVVRRHETLRTTFAVQGGEPVQVISPSLAITLPVTDLRHLPQAEREAEALRLARLEARKSFNLSQGPLVRVELLRLDEEEYIFLFTMHHIISDGWSMGVFIGELTALYHAFSHSRPSPLPELPIQYADYAHWQREWLRGEVLEKQLAYWKQQLGGNLPVLNLPTDRPRPAVQTSAGANLHTKFPRELSEALVSLSRREGATLFMTLTAALETLLYRYTGQEDITIGSPIANRQRPEIERLIGCFINTLVLRADFSGNPTFRELLRQVRETTLEAYAHQELPFEMLVEALQPERDLSHSPLFQVMLILQNATAQGAPATAQPRAAIEVSQLAIDSGTATFDLTLSVTESPDGLSVSAEYNTDLFDAATIERLLAHYRTLLEGIVADPDQRVAQLPLLTETERRQILTEWNNTAANYALDKCVHRLIEAQAEAQPDAVAVVCNNDRLTYRELSERANQLAHQLQRLGIGPEKFVGICAEKSVELIVAVLGVLKAGGAYVPLDPTHPADRLSFMLEDTGMTVLLTQSQLRSQVEHLKPELHLVCLDRDWPVIAEESPQNPASEVRPGNLAYVIYTSGSTGRPKGVMIEHRSLLNSFLAWKEAYELDSVRAHLQMANFAFDVFSGDFVRALCSGGRLVLCPRETLLDAAELYALMRREAVDCAEFVPAVLRPLAQHLEQTGQKLDFMRNLICGSDTWYAGEYQRFQKLCGPRTRLINSFGLTEAAVDSSYFESSTLALSADQLVPIGRPFANTQLYILDTHQQPVPIGVTGELYVGGAGLARGYLNNPQLTAEKFLELQIAEEEFRKAASAKLKAQSSKLKSATRLYRTGDLARFLPDGNIQFLGRADYQVKIRGFRIEPGEVEAALTSHPGVRQAVVNVCKDPRGADCLVAYFTAKSDAAPAAGELRRFAADKLPAFMVPAAFVMMDELPLNSNGKVDRNALPAPDWESRTEDEFVAPRNETEETLAGIWRQVLNLSRVGIHEIFFELGGHSLLATQVTSRVREAFGVELPLRNVFEFPTIATLAEQIEKLQRTTTRLQAPPIRPVPRDGALPLSFAQQRLWFLEQLEPGSAAYNIPDAYRLRGPLDVAVFERCVNEIIRRHESLRTTFQTVGGKPLQVIAPELRLQIPVISLESPDSAQREAEVKRLAREAASQPFDIARGPLLRVKLLRLEAEDHIVLLTTHHIVSDGWSSNILLREITILYQAFVTGQPSPLPEPQLQYADYAHWQRTWLQGDTLAAQLAYWKKQLADSPPLLELPTDRPRPAVQTFNGSYCKFELSGELSTRLNALSQRAGVTPFMALLAAFQLLLHRYTGQDDINIGTPVAGRNRAETENLIGLFVNTLVLRGRLDGDPVFTELLQQVRETALGAYDHQDLPFEMIVDELRLERNLSWSPLFQVMFVMQNNPADAQSVPGAKLTISEVETWSGTAKFDLTLFMTESPTGYAGLFEYNTDLFDQTTIERMIGHFRTLLESIAARPEERISRLPVLTDAESHQILVEWNQTDADFPADQCFHELFAAQAARTPDAIAVMCGEQQLTFQALNARATQLARYLRKRGAGPETLVALCVERSLEMVVGLLGVLKAGAAYVPVDPTYPADRMAWMLTDSQAPLLLTQSHLKSQIEHLRSELHLVCLDADWPQIAEESTDEFESGAGPDNLAYVIYTSGSTGRPKGALIGHRGLVNYLTWCLRAYPLAEGSGSIVHSSISFDLTVTSLFAPLLAGRRVVLVPEGEGAAALGEALRREENLSLVKITPAHLKLLGQQLEPAEAAGRTRAFIIGGENLTADHIAFWREHAPETKLINEYGPTETVVGCCVYETPRHEHLSGVIPIGRPIINTQLYILDKYQQPVPVGVPGELYIGGAGVARGYLNRPELTAEKFIEWAVVSSQWAVATDRGPLPTDNGQRLYRTGDLVRYLPDGRIECLGRTDDQVKIRGYRVELGEIEAALCEEAGVKDAAVIAPADTSGHRRLIAYVVSEGDTPLNVNELRAGLQRRLPEYMVPAVFVPLDEMPLTANGKVDRKRLPAPEVERSATAVEYVAPRNEIEAKLAEIWQEVLNVRQVGVLDNFFELGGDSILSIQIIARANEAGIRLTPKDLFQFPTVAGLAAIAEADQTAMAALDQWVTSLTGETVKTPLDFADGMNTPDSERTVTVALSRAETEALWQEVSDTGRTEIHDLLITALLRAWAEWTGANDLLLDYRYRHSPAPGRTERLALYCPLRLTHQADLSECLDAVKGQLRRAPHRQSGETLLRLLGAAELRERLSALPAAPLSFTYCAETEAVGESAATGARSYLIEVVCRMEAGQLQADWIYSANLHERATIESLAQGFVSALSALLQQIAGHYSASDFADFGWDSGDLDNILAAIDQSGSDHH